MRAGFLCCVLTAASCSERSASGNVPEGGACEETGECAPGLACVDGTCHRLCGSSSECAATQACDDGVCKEVSNPSCTGSAQCTTPGPCEEAGGAACIAGECEYPPVAALTRCDLTGLPPGSLTGYCAAGACVECTMPSHCTTPPTTYTVCFDASCAGNTCSYQAQAGRSCAALECTDGYVYDERFCNANGDCPYPAPPGTSCNGYACADATTCKTSCADNTDCAGGLTCLPNQTCEAPRNIGEPCAIGAECTSGFCADSVCCDSDCGGNCDRCNVAGQAGACVADDTACTGNCDQCDAASGNCMPDAALCTGNCDVCSGTGNAFDCAADQTACTGDCDTCSGGGSAFSCTSDQSICGICSTCSGGGTSYACTGNICPDIPISSDYQHTCAVRPNKTVACWGANASGQLGNGATSTGATTTAQTVTGLSNVVSVAVTTAFSCAVRRDGTAWCWGGNDQTNCTYTYSRLGNGGGSAYETTPVQVSGLTTVIQVAVGPDFGCALLVDGSIRCWGHDYAGQHGNGGAAPGAGCSSIEYSTTPAAPVVGITTGRWLAANAQGQACAALAGGGVQCWGDNWYGQLGNGNEGSAFSSNVPVAVANITGAAKVESGWSHVCAVLSGGGTRCWGLNNTGQCGDGTSGGNKTTPVTVSGVSTAVDISSGWFYDACAVLSNGALTCWGNNSSGKLGDGTTANSSLPVTAQQTNVRAVAAGLDHTCVMLNDNTVRCWGSNSLGQLGNNSTTPSTSPVQVVGF